MTTPSERTRAVIELEADLRRLLTAHATGRGETVRVHRSDLARLAGWLRHYPTGAAGSATVSPVRSVRWQNAACRPAQRATQRATERA